jgi:hypothetical protein
MVEWRAKSPEIVFDFARNTLLMSHVVKIIYKIDSY